MNFYTIGYRNKCDAFCTHLSNMTWLENKLKLTLKISFIQGIMTVAAWALFVKHPRAQGEWYNQNPSKWCSQNPSDSRVCLHHLAWALWCFTNNAQAARSVFPFKHETRDLSIPMKIVPHSSRWTWRRGYLVHGNLYIRGINWPAGFDIHAFNSYVTHGLCLVSMSCRKWRMVSSVTTATTCDKILIFFKRAFFLITLPSFCWKGIRVPTHDALRK